MWLLPLVALSLTTVTLATRYQKQIILVMGQSQTELEAAQLLYKKHPDISTELKWNKEDKKFDLSPGNNLDSVFMDFSKTRIQVVGHGGMTEKQIPTLGGLSPDELAEALNSLYPEDSRAEVDGKRVNQISWIRLVGCKCAGGDNSNVPPKDTFCGMLISILKNKYAIETSISAYKTPIGVDSTGTIVTDYSLSKDGIVTWRRKNPAAEVVYTLIQDNIVTSSMPDETGGDVITRGIKSYKNGIIVNVRKEDGETKHVRLSSCTLNDIIDGATRNIFDNAAENQTAGLKTYIVRERAENTKGYADNVRKVRHINSHQDFVNEINFYGKRSRRLEGFEYYQFSDFVYRIDRGDFYVYESGVILAEVPADEPDDVPETTIEMLVSQSKYKDLNADQIPKIGKKYSEMTGVDCNYFSDMRKFMDGKGEDITVDLNDEAAWIAKAINGKRIIAMVLSESIRKFQSHVADMIALDLDAHDLLNYVEYFKAHPMAQGGTWPRHIDGRQHPNPTGFKGSYGDYSLEQLDSYVFNRLLSSIKKKQATKIIENAKSVRNRLSNFLGTWLSNIEDKTLSIDIGSGKKRFIEQYHGAGIPADTIYNVSSEYYQAVINATQDALVKNFRATTEKSTTIMDSPIKIAGPLQEQTVEVADSFESSMPPNTCQNPDFYDVIFEDNNNIMCCIEDGIIYYYFL